MRGGREGRGQAVQGEKALRPTDRHTHARARALAPCISRLSEASGSLPDHYLPYLPCDDDDGPTCEHHRQALLLLLLLLPTYATYSHTHVLPSRRSHALAELELRFPASTPRVPSRTRPRPCTYVCVCRARVSVRSRTTNITLAHTERASERASRRGGDRASAPLGGSRVNYRLDRILCCLVVFQRAERK